MVFHLIDRAGWALAVEQGSHRPPSLAAEGFVHLSTRAQVLGTANRFFRGRTDLLLLQIDEGSLTGALKYEEGEPGQLFPHFYGPLPVSAILAVLSLEVDDAGGFSRMPAGA